MFIFNRIKLDIQVLGFFFFYQKSDYENQKSILLKFLLCIVSYQD